MMWLRSWRFLAIRTAAFRLSLNMADLLELPRRMQFARDPWVEVAVVEGVYALFGSVGAVCEIGAILGAFVLVETPRTTPAPSNARGASR